jgi:hypothetical protein
MEAQKSEGTEKSVAGDSDCGDGNVGDLGEAAVVDDSAVPPGIDAAWLHVSGVMDMKRQAGNDDAGRARKKITKRTEFLRMGVVTNEISVSPGKFRRVGSSGQRAVLSVSGYVGRIEMEGRLRAEGQASKPVQNVRAALPHRPVTARSAR